jgi:hypothetical protein
MNDKLKIPTYMPNKYIGPDITNRLDQCLAFYKGEPFYVRANGNSLNLYPLPLSHKDPTHTTIKPNDPDFDISSPELGYSNAVKEDVGSNYVKLFVRLSYRRGYKQGVWEGNSRVYNIDGTPLGALSLADKSLYRLLKNDFPKYEEALLILESSGQVAFCPDFAAKKLKVGVRVMYYRGEEIGVFSPEDGTIVIRPGPGNEVFKKIMKTDKPWRIV